MGTIISPCLRCNKPVYTDMAGPGNYLRECSSCRAAREVDVYRETVLRIGTEFRKGLMTDEEFIDRIFFVNDDFFSS